jgi:hypothetical protein
VNELQHRDNVPAAPADNFRWEDIDQRLLSSKTSDLADEMQKRVAEGERKIEFDTQRSGNAAGYLPRLFDFHEGLTHEWAERLYSVYCEVWVQQNRTVSAAFIRAVRDLAITQLIAVRKSSVQFAVVLRGTRIGEPPNPAALGEWNRRMDRLAARWNRTLEADAVESDYRAAGEAARRREEEVKNNSRTDNVAEKGEKPIDRWLALFALAVGAALYLLPKTQPVIIGCCILIWGSLVHPFIHFWWVEDRKWRQVLAATVLTTGVVFLCLYIKPEKPHESQAEKKGEEIRPVGHPAKSESTQPAQSGNPPPTVPRAGRVPHIHVNGIQPFQSSPGGPLKAGVEITNNGTADADVISRGAISMGEVFPDQKRQREWENFLFRQNVQVPLSFDMDETNTVREGGTHTLQIERPWSDWQRDWNKRELGHSYVIYFMGKSKYRSHRDRAFVRVTEFCKFFTEDGSTIAQCKEHNVEPR